MGPKSGFGLEESPLFEVPYSTHLLPPPQKKKRKPGYGPDCFKGALDKYSLFARFRHLRGEPQSASIMKTLPNRSIMARFLLLKTTDLAMGEYVVM